MKHVSKYQERDNSLFTRLFGGRWHTVGDMWIENWVVSYLDDNPTKQCPYKDSYGTWIVRINPDWKDS